MYPDYLFYGIDIETRYAFRMLHLTNIVREAQKMHGLSAPLGKILGDTLLGSVLLSSVLLEEERINLRVHCGSEFTAAAETTRNAQTRGYLEFQPQSVLIQHLEEGNPLSGVTHIRTLRSNSKGKLNEGHTVYDVTGELEDALNDHLERSFQMELGVRLECWQDPVDGQLRAFGAIFMELPNIADDVSHALRHHVNSLPRMSELFSKNDDPDVLARALIPHPLKPIKSVTPSWDCTCSQGSIERMLISLPATEVEDMIKKNEPLDIRCHYCNKNFSVSPARLKEVAEFGRMGTDTPQVKH